MTSDPDPVTGDYRATIAWGRDHSRILDKDAALAYASTIFDAAQRAEYDAAVVRQLTTLPDIDVDAAVGVLRDVWEDRPDLDSTAIAPMLLQPGLNKREMRPGIVVHLDDGDKPRTLGTWTVQQAREHATQVMETVWAVDLDSAYLRFLRGTMDLDAGTARAMISDLANHRTS
ncbi:hypothetical protein [Streptomyces sp. TR02-1]|uniref:hypothetical protein n=1 Tax=Streptomyces sp. TR02-1 TaxID=3385977 RepID=UPI0039A0170B